MEGMKPAISLQNLTVLRGGETILANITADLPAGKIIGLLGPSGAGKTTLMRAIVGRQAVGRGSVTVLGLPAGDSSLRRDIGYVTQAPAVYNDLTIQENLAYFAAMVAVPQERVTEVLETVHLTKYKTRVVGTLSGGQKSRTSLAAALLNQPPLLLLDEPTVGIDPLIRHEMWEYFQTLKQQGTTLVVTSHVMDEAAYCDELLLLRDGRLLAYGSLQELYAQTGASDVEAVFLQLIGAKA